MLGASCANVNMGIKEICCLMRAYEASPLGSRWERRVFFLFEFSAHSYPLRRSLPRCRLSQLLACHVATRCKQLDEQQNALMEAGTEVVSGPKIGLFSYRLGKGKRLTQYKKVDHSKLQSECSPCEQVEALWGMDGN